MERPLAGDVAVRGSLGDPLAVHVLALLERPRTLDELRLALRVPRREVEAAVEALRLSGEPIVGGNDGLRLTSDPDELERYISRREDRIRSIVMGNHALRETVRAMRERADAEADLTLFGAAA